MQLKTAGERAIAFDRTGEVSRGHSTGDYSTDFVSVVNVYGKARTVPLGTGVCMKRVVNQS